MSNRFLPQGKKDTGLIASQVALERVEKILDLTSVEGIESKMSEVQL